MTQYKTVSLGYITCKYTTGVTDKIAEQTLAPVAKKIQAEAVGGWKFHSLVQVPVIAEPGCIGKLLKRATFTSNYCMLIFEKEE